MSDMKVYIGSGYLVDDCILYASFLLADDFSVDDAAPLTSPHACDITGSMNVTDPGNFLSIASGELQFAGMTTANTTPRIMNASSIARAAGLMIVASIRVNTLPQLSVGWRSGSDAGSPNRSAVVLHNTSVALNYNAYLLSLLGSDFISANTQYLVASVLKATGSYLFIKGGVFTRWTMIWSDATETSATLFGGIGAANTDGTNSYVKRIRILQSTNALYTAVEGLAIYNENTPADNSSRSGSADGIKQMDVTAAGILAGNAHLETRRADANNKWDMYVTSTGTFNLDSVVAGVATNRITSAGIIIATQNRIFRQISYGSKHKCYQRQSSTVWAQIGSQVDVSLAGDAVDTELVTYSSYTMNNIRAFPENSPNYDNELCKVGLTL